MSVAASESTSSEPERSQRPARRWPLVLGGLGAVSAVFAALVIFSSTTATSPARDPVAPLSADPEVLTVGPSSAATEVVVYEDFGSPASRTFDISSRDFLREEAARGRVVVEYRPLTLSESELSRSAAGTWRLVADRGTPAQARALHDLLFDRAPTADDPAPSELVTLAERAGVEDPALLEAVASAAAAPAPAPAAGSAAGSAAGVRTTPRVLVDGQPLTATSPVALADRLQRLLLDRSRA